MPKNKYDVIVVGGGSAGCVMASRLSEDPTRNVLLIEAGPDYGAYQLGRWPSDILDERILPLENHDWGFGDSDAARARVLGGCSSVNASLVVWPAPGDFDRWLSLGNQGWGFADQFSHAKRAETAIGNHVPAPESMSWFVEPFIRGCEMVGYPRLVGLNGPEWTAGVAPVPRNVIDGVRWNAAFAYLDPVRSRPNLTIRGDTLVDRVLFEGDRVSGVTVWGEDGQTRIEADSVVLSAGAYLTPAVLHRSGVGPPELLKKLGIPIQVPLEGVGRNLVDHAGALVRFKMDSLVHSPTNRLPEVILHTRSSLVFDAYWDAQVLIWHEGTDSEGTLNFGLHAMESDSTGSVSTVSSDPKILPVVHQPWTSLSEHDTQVLADTIELVRQICATGAFGPGLGEEITPGPVADLPSWIRANTGGYWHPSGTCRMGPDNDANAVVDAQGRVHGRQGLRVVDASIFPTVPRASTNIATLAAAEFIASTM